MRRSVLALISAALAAPTAAAQAPLSHEVVRVTGAEPRGAVESSVAINPTNPDHFIAVSLAPGRGGTTNYAYVSTDGGKTWKTVATPNPDRRTQGDDSVAFTADGTAVHIYISFAGVFGRRPPRAASGIYASTSKDGLTWSAPIAVVDHVNTATPHWDKPYVRVDAAPDSPHKGSIYTAITRFDEYGSKRPEDKTHIYFSRSKDGGKTFSVPHRVSEEPGDCIDSDNTVMGAMPAVGPKGEVYLVWAGPKGLYFDKSADGGWTFGADKVIVETPGGWDYPVKGLGRCNGLPVTAVDISKGKDAGTLYVNWVDARNGDPDVLVMASRDGGATWEPPVRVNDDPKGNGKEQFFTWMAVDPEDGSVNVIFYDRRDTAADGTETKLTLARSTDGGRTFVNHPVKQDPFPCERRGFFGDYCGIDARGGRVVAVYPTYDANKQLGLSAAVFRFPSSNARAAGPTAAELRELLTRPHNEMAAVAARYQADRGSLTRTYAVPGSPTRHARLTKFYADWLAALEALPADKLSEPARPERERLLTAVRGELKDLDRQARERADVAPLVPFAAVVIDLDEARRRVERLDAPKAAGVLTGLKKQIDEAKKALTAGPVSKRRANRAADAVAVLRGTMRAWHGFYDGYDPLFTWWMAEPYKEADKALQEYAAALQTAAKAAADDPAETEPAPAAPPARSTGTPSDAPDLPALIAARTEGMAAVVRRYQSERGGGGGRGRGGPGPADSERPPDRTARTAAHYEAWLAALGGLDFDALGRDGQVDYLLLQNHIRHELRKLRLPSQGRGSGPGRRDETGITCRPIGREALLAELAGELIPYSPEELVVIAETEYAWCAAELRRAAREMGFGDDWKKAVEKVKTMHVEPGRQPEAIRDLAREAIDYLAAHDLVTVPPLAAETWRMQMMSPARQLVNPFFTGGETISVSFPTHTMAHDAKLQSLRGNNVPFSRATVHHELIPGHHLQGFSTARHRTHRAMFNTPFWGEGWALYWEFVLYERGFPKTPEDRVGFLFWRTHRCARIIFSLNFHLGRWSPKECIDFLVEQVGHERDNATAEVRRSFAGGYGPLYQAAYMLGGLQFRALRRELVESGRMTDRAFHDAVLHENRMPVALVRAALSGQTLTRDGPAEWKFYAPSARMSDAPEKR